MVSRQYKYKYRRGGLAALALSASLFFQAVEAQAQNPAYEARAQAALAGLARLNGLIGWPPENPAAWPALTEDFSRLRRAGGGRPAVGALFDQERPARLVGLALTGQGLTKAADLSGLSALGFLDLSGNRLRGLNLAGAGSLVSLAALKNQLTALNLSSSPRLAILYLSGNELARLDLSAAPLLTEADLSRNRLTELDLSRNPALTRLEVAGNQLRALDLSANRELVRLSAAYNRLSDFKAEGLPRLEELSLKSNALISLDLRGAPALRELAVGRNRLTELDLGDRPGLLRLEAEHNRLSRLDLSGAPALAELDLQGNPLAELKLAAGAPLAALNLDGGRLPLSGLAPLTGLAPGRRRLGRQSKVLFEEKRLAPRETLDLSAEAEFGGEPTEFTVLNEKSRRVRPEFYDLAGGRLRFNAPGRYLVEMTNPQVFSSEKIGLTGRERRIKTRAVTGLVQVVTEPPTAVP